MQRSARDNQPLTYGASGCGRHGANFQHPETQPRIKERITKVGWQCCPIQTARVWVPSLCDTYCSQAFMCIHGLSFKTRNKNACRMHLVWSLSNMRCIGMLKVLRRQACLHVLRCRHPRSCMHLLICSTFEDLHQRAMHFIMTNQGTCAQHQVAQAKTQSTRSLDLNG